MCNGHDRTRGGKWSEGRVSHGCLPPWLCRRLSTQPARGDAKDDQGLTRPRTGMPATGGNGHEKICVITSVLEDQQTLRFIVFCTLEKLCVTPMYRLRVSRN